MAHQSLNLDFYFYTPYPLSIKLNKTERKQVRGWINALGGLIAGVILTLLIGHRGEDWAENIGLSDNKYTFGLDVSEYQGRIDWSEVRTSHHPIQYVFIRSTMGRDGKDAEFSRNWKKAKKRGYIRGAYHYYRPNENSTEQFNNFSKTVRLEKGDFKVILDVEKMSIHGPDNLRQGVKNWINLAEQKYGHKPMIYSGRDFYVNHLKGHIPEDCLLWIAAYSGKSRLRGTDWHFHQFTEHVRVKGIETTVDGNDFDGTLLDLQNYCIQ